MSVAGTVLRLGVACEGPTGTVGSRLILWGRYRRAVLADLARPAHFFTNLVAVASSCRSTQVMESSWIVNSHVSSGHIPALYSCSF